jgi:hypothetical protein
MTAGVGMHPEDAVVRGKLLVMLPHSRQFIQ